MTASEGRFIEVKLVVGIAQLVELWIVIPAVVGSSPIVHPNFPVFSLRHFRVADPAAIA